jgi:hypothetical protein
VPLVAAYRLVFDVAKAATARVHVSADERYELFLNGVRVGRGPERGDPANWFFESHDLSLTPGPHVMVARVWSLGATGADAQMAVSHGFLFAPEGVWTARLGTGVAPWEVMALDAYSFEDKAPAFWRAAALTIDGRRCEWGIETGEARGWRPATVGRRAMGRWWGWTLENEHRLRPAMLPSLVDRRFPTPGPRRPGEGSASREARAPLPRVRHICAWALCDDPVRGRNHLPEEAPAWEALLAGEGAVTVGAHTARRAIVDLDTYLCAYPELVTSGGTDAVIRIAWAETLYGSPEATPEDKGHRDEIEGKYFVGRGDTFLTDGGTGRRYEPLWWQAGRYVQIHVRAAADAVTLERLAFHETRYPLEMESHIQVSDAELTRLVPTCVRAMQVAANETYFDSPYYEEMQYTGDTRIECLVTHVMTRDDRLPRKAAVLFDSSRLANGFTQSRYPTRAPQVIPGFALWWICMVHDHAMWRDAETARLLLPGVRATLAAFGRYMRDGLFTAPDGWNFADWVEGWEAGIPPDGLVGASGVLNWHLVYALGVAADLERRMGAPQIAVWCESWRDELAARATEAFWDEGRGMLADDTSRRHFSEHTQCLAILSGALDPALAARAAGALLEEPGLARTTLYFSHYLFEALRGLGRVDRVLARIGEQWYPLLDRGLRTTVEKPEPTRSDCHAWSAHPLFHLFATVLGIRPSAPGFASVEVRPQLGGLARAAGILVHPRGEVHVECVSERGVLRGVVRLPPDVDGVLVLGSERRPLAPGGEARF